MKLRSIIIILSSLIISGTASVAGQGRTVALTEVEKALKTAAAGDTIYIRSGEYRDIKLKLRASGTQERPVVVAAKDKGQVKITGESSLKIAGEWLVVSGLLFTDGAAPQGDPVIEYRIGKDAAVNCRITDCVIDAFNPASRETGNSYVHIYGRGNRFDHNSLTGKLNLGVTLIVMLSQERDQKNFHRIDHNYFGYRPVYGSNGAETIRVGTSQQGDKSSNTIIENNYFERCNGEVEVISIKSCDNVVRGNVFYECEGVLALRHGDRNLAEGNVFIGNGVRNTGGIRVVNEGHTVTGNTFYRLDGGRFFSALALMNAVPNSLPNRYSHVKDITVSNNNFIMCREIGFGTGRDEERTLAPADIRFIGNTIYNPGADRVFDAIDDLAGFTFKNNITTPVTGSVPGGFKVKNMPEPALPALPVEKTSTGAAWWRDKKCCVVAQDAGRVIRVEAGQDALSDAVRHAKAADIIELATAGEYPLSESVDVRVPLTIRAAEGLGSRPRVRFNGSKKADMVTIHDGGELVIRGIEFSGELEPGRSLASAGISSATGMIHPYNLTVEDCLFRDFNEGGFFPIRGRKNTFAETVVIRDCVFTDLSGTAIDYSAEKDDIGRYNADDVTIENCAFNNLLGPAINIYRGGSDESTAGPYVKVAHCTFENVCNQERGSSVRLIGPQVLAVTDCIFSNSGRGGAAIRLDEATWEKVSVKNCNFWNSGRIITMTGTVVKGEMYTLKPIYKNEGALDFGQSNDSPLKGLANDGSDIGVNR